MKIQYLTWLYEKTGKHEDYIDLPEDVKSIDDLIAYLEKERPECRTIFQNRHVIYTAVNDEIKQPDYPISNQDRISFFSAVVGG